MEIYMLTIIKETRDEQTEIETTLYANPEDAIEAYNKAFNEAQEEAKEYGRAWIDDEIATNTPYRWCQICDLDGWDCITIELEAQEVM